MKTFNYSLEGTVLENYFIPRKIFPLTWLARQKKKNLDPALADLWKHSSQPLLKSQPISPYMEGSKLPNWLIDCVSLTCIPCKLLEHIVCSNIMAYLNEYELLTDRQHAFKKWHICELQLTTFINDWAKILDKRDRLIL